MDKSYIFYNRLVQVFLSWSISSVVGLQDIFRMGKTYNWLKKRPIQGCNF